MKEDPFQKISESMQPIISLIDAEMWREALEAIDELPGDIRGRGRVSILRGDCLYELKDDLGALAAYSSYLEKWPDGRGHKVALMGAACCLLNLNLDADALLLLRQMEEGYPKKMEYIEDAESLLQKQEQARALIAHLQSGDRR